MRNMQRTRRSRRSLSNARSTSATHNLSSIINSSLCWKRFYYGGRRCGKAVFWPGVHVRTSSNKAATGDRIVIFPFGGDQTYNENTKLTTMVYAEQKYKVSTMVNFSNSQSVRDATLAAATAFDPKAHQTVNTQELALGSASSKIKPGAGNVWNLEVDKAIDLAKAICAAVLFNVIQDDASTTGSFDQAVQKHMSSRDSQLQVLQRAQDWLADNDAVNLLEMLLWSGYKNVECPEEGSRAVKAAVREQFREVQRLARWVDHHHELQRQQLAECNKARRLLAMPEEESNEEESEEDEAARKRRRMDVSESVADTQQQQQQQQRSTLTPTARAMEELEHLALDDAAVLKVAKAFRDRNPLSFMRLYHKLNREEQQRELKHMREEEQLVIAIQREKKETWRNPRFILRYLWLTNLALCNDKPCDGAHAARNTQAIGKLVDAAQTGKADLRCLLNECVESDPRSSDSSRVQAHESLLNVLRDGCFEASRRMLAEPPLPGSEWRNHNYVVSASSANDTYMNYNTPGMARPRMSIIEHRRARWEFLRDMMVARDRMLWELHVRSRHDGLWKGKDGREWTIAGEHLQENATGRTTRVALDDEDAALMPSQRPNTICAASVGMLREGAATAEIEWADGDIWKRKRAAPTTKGRCRCVMCYGDLHLPQSHADEGEPRRMLRSGHEWIGRQIIQDNICRQSHGTIIGWYPSPRDYAAVRCTLASAKSTEPHCNATQHDDASADHGSSDSGKTSSASSATRGTPEGCDEATGMARLLGLSTAFCSTVLAHAGSRQKAIDFVVTASAKEVVRVVTKSSGRSSKRKRDETSATEQSMWVVINHQNNQLTHFTRHELKPLLAPLGQQELLFIPASPKAKAARQLPLVSWDDRERDKLVRSKVYTRGANVYSHLCCAHCGVHFHFMCRERWYRERGYDPGLDHGTRPVEREVLGRMSTLCPLCLEGERLCRFAYTGAFVNIKNLLAGGIASPFYLRHRMAPPLPGDASEAPAKGGAASTKAAGVRRDIGRHYPLALLCAYAVGAFTDAQAKRQDMLLGQRCPSIYRGMTLVMLLLDIFDREQLLAPPYKTMINAVCQPLWTHDFSGLSFVGEKKHPKDKRWAIVTFHHKELQLLLQRRSGMEPHLLHPELEDADGSNTTIACSQISWKCATCDAVNPVGAEMYEGVVTSNGLRNPQREFACPQCKQITKRRGLVLLVNGLGISGLSVRAKNSAVTAKVLSALRHTAKRHSRKRRSELSPHPADISSGNARFPIIVVDPSNSDTADLQSEAVKGIRLDLNAMMFDYNFYVSTCVPAANVKYEWGMPGQMQEWTQRRKFNLNRLGPCCTRLQPKRSELLARNASPSEHAATGTLLSERICCVTEKSHPVNLGVKVAEECNPTCACDASDSECGCRHTQFPVQCRLALFRNHKGWGVMTLDRIERGSYVCTYSGDIIRDDKAAREAAFRALVKRADATGDRSILEKTNDYIWQISSNFAVDAKRRRSIGAFINHSCSNQTLVPVRVWNHHKDMNIPLLAFYAKVPLDPLTELTVNYGAKFFKCICDACVRNKITGSTLPT